MPNMSDFRKHAPKTKSISSFDVPCFEFLKTEDECPYFYNFTEDLGVVVISLWFPTGRLAQKSPFVAQAAFDLILSGAKGRSEKEIMKYIDHLGGSVTNDVNDWGSKITIRSSVEQAKNILSWVEDHVVNAEYPEEEISHYIPVKSAGIDRKKQTPNYWSQLLAKQTLYNNHNLGKTGDIKDVQALNRGAIWDFYSSEIKTSGPLLFVSGDCSGSLFSELMSIHRSFFPKPFPLSNPFVDLEKPTQYFDNSGVIKHTLSSSNQVSMVLQCHVEQTEPKTNFQLILLNFVLGGYFGSRLMQELREKQGLTYGISSYFRPAYLGKTWVISGEMNSENAAIALEKTLDIIEDLRINLISVDELERAKRYYGGMFRQGFDGPFSAAVKAQSIFLQDLKPDYYQTALPEIWKTTPEDLLTLAQTHLNPQNFVKVLAGKV